MTEPKVVHAQPDIDIEAALHELLTSYAPLMHDRHNVHLNVEDGVVTVHGYVKGRPAYLYLLNGIPQVKGVKALHTEKFYADEGLRLEVGRMIPAGISVTMEYGSAILSGTLPEGTSAEEVVKQVATVEGIHRVVTSFS